MGIRERQPWTRRWMCMMRPAQAREGAVEGLHQQHEASSHQPRSPVNHHEASSHTQWGQLREGKTLTRLHGSVTTPSFGGDVNPDATARACGNDAEKQRPDQPDSQKLHGPRCTWSAMSGGSWRGPHKKNTNQQRGERDGQSLRDTTTADVDNPHQQFKIC